MLIDPSSDWCRFHGWDGVTGSPCCAFHLLHYNNEGSSQAERSLPVSLPGYQLPGFNHLISHITEPFNAIGKRTIETLIVYHGTHDLQMVAMATEWLRRNPMKRITNCLISHIQANMMLCRSHTSTKRVQNYKCSTSMYKFFNLAISKAKWIEIALYQLPLKHYCWYIHIPVWLIIWHAVFHIRQTQLHALNARDADIRWHNLNHKYV